MPSSPPPQTVSPTGCLGPGPLLPVPPVPWVLVLGCPSQAKSLPHHAAVTSHRMTSWMGLPLDTGFLFSPSLLLSIPELCPLSAVLLAPASWHLIWLLHLDPQAAVRHASNKACSALRTSPSQSALPLLVQGETETQWAQRISSWAVLGEGWGSESHSLAEALQKLLSSGRRTEVSKLAFALKPKTNIVNFNGRAHHLFNNSWFSERKADGVIKHFSVKTYSTWFQKH